jgi:hypothetical protein
MRRPGFRSFAAVVLASCLLTPAVADARGLLVKFTVVEWRMDLEVSNDPEAPPKMELTFKGTAKALGNEGIGFRWKVKNPRPYMDLLKACGGNRLFGEVEYDDEIDRNQKDIEGEGQLSTLSCRAILR